MATEGGWLFAGYVLAYAVATIGCLAALVRARGIADDETRHGLVSVLAGSGGWAALQLGYLVAPTDVAYALYLGSLVVGLATIGAWLYFCSAYTGRSFHRSRAFRWTAVGVYLAIVGVKLTNPIHGIYFSTEVVTSPFTFLAIEHGLFHWLVSGFSYALAAIGFFMLYEVLVEADYETRPFAALLAAAGLPVVLDIASLLSPRLLEINYEPLGVAVFAVGVLYVFEDRFLAVQLTDGVDGAVVYLDDAGQIREYNGQAERLFPSLSGATGDQFADALPDAAEQLDGDTAILERDADAGTRYYLVSDTEFTLGQSDIGRLVTFTDVTETERRRRELERHNEQLEGFAAAIRHELLNTLQIVKGRVDIAGEALEDGNVERARDSLRTMSETNDRMTDVVDDLADMARYGRTVETTQPVPFRPAVEAAFETAETDDLGLVVEGAGTVEGEGERLQDLLESAFEFAAHNDADTVTVTLHEDGFAVTDDGDPPPTDDPEAFFEYGGALPDKGAGMTLPNVRTVARTLGWETAVDTDYDDGVRVVVTGPTVEREAAAD